jgi:PKD repeat protein
MLSKSTNQNNMLQIATKARPIEGLCASWKAIMAAIFCLLIGQAHAQVGTWTALTNKAPDPNNGVMVLMSDGRVMCHSTAGGTLGDGTIWDILTPDSTGSYAHGTWSQTAGMTQERYSFPAAMLKNGNIYAAGGEYGTDGTQAGYHVETYNPVTNVWTEVTGTTTAKIISDGSMQILDNGDVIQALVDVSFPVHTNFYTPSTNAMTSAPSTLHGQNESMWLKLPDNSVLFVDEGATTSERYIPATNTWIADGTVPVSLYDPYGEECGPAWMLPNGKAFFVGGTNTAAIYTPSGTTAAGTWASAAAMPNGYGMPDAPGAMMPNGKILLAGSPQPTGSGNNEFHTPTEFFEYNYLTNSYATVAAPNATEASGAISQQYNMLVLPNGQVLLGEDQGSTNAISQQYYVYTPVGAPLDTFRPIITQIVPLSCTSYMAIGHRFNGISSGAAFGDENENDENYPLFRFKAANGNVYFGRSYNWNSRGVQRGLNVIDTAYFDLSASMPVGTYYLQAVANGIASDSMLFTSGIASLSSPTNYSICSGSTFSYTPASAASGATFSWTRPAVTGISNAAITTPQTTNPNETLTNTTSLPITVNYVYSVTGGGCSNTENVAVVVNPKPAASFTATPVTSCILPDSVTFTNTTVAGTSYVWTFGDGSTTSTSTNPVHAYTAPGSFSVKLVASSACGVDSVTTANYIAVTAPAGPTVASLTPHCGSTAFTLTANTANHVAWYNAAGTFLSSANPYTTGVLTATQTFYVDDTIPAAIDSVGPATYTTLGTGANFGNTNQHYMTFDALSDFTLVSVLVEASTAGARTIQLINSAGTVIATASPTIPTGVSTVTLNFSVPKGTGYELSCGGTGTTAIELYRNSAVPAGSYPFTIANIVSITGNDVGTGYYYYFYDWKVQPDPCISARTAVTATINPTVSAAAHVQEVPCYGGATGTDTAVVTGGTQAFSYKWSNNLTSPVISGLTAGTYTLTVTDANQCTATATSTITQPTAALAQTGAVTEPTCASPSSGRIVLTVTGGTSAYSYLWSTAPAQSRDTATGLTAGSYTVTVTDAHSCTSTATYTVTAPSGGITLSTSAVNATCGTSNGTASVSVTSGAGTYTYAWSAGGSTTATNANIPAGTYTVTVTSTAGGCSATASVQVGSSGGPTLTPAFTNTTCGLSNGSAHVIPSGGTAPFTYLWSNAATDSAITGLAAGTYTVTVKDVHGCASTSSVTVTASSAPALTASSTATTCGLNNGAASIAVANPSSPTYTWSNSSTAASITGLASGTYTVTVNNAGCSATSTISVAASSPATFASSATATTCGLHNGVATVTSVTNPSNPTYLWSTGATTPSITGLASGSYTVTVTNGGCTASSAVSVSPSTATAFTTSSVATTCGNNNGTATATLTGTPSNTTYLWSNNATTAAITGVAAGSYTVTVTNNGCSATASVSVAASSSTRFTTSSTATTCGHTNGTATAVLTGTAVNTTYLWSTAATTASITGVAAGSYTVTVTNNGCSATATVSVAGSTAPTLNSSATATTCGLDNGTATAAEANPTSPAYTWSNSASTASITGLAPGTYTVTVSDQGCTATATVSVATSAPTVFTTSSTATTCGNANGSATASLTGTPINTTYLWSNSATTAAITGAAAGTYTVTVTNNGCSATATVSVAASAPLPIQVSATDAVCTLANGTATVSETNPISPTYLWSTSATTATITGVAAGTYTVTVNDNGCSATASVSVGQSSGTLAVSATPTPEPCFGDGLATASATASGGTPTYTYAWSNSTNGSSVTGLTAGTYVVTVSDNGGCQTTAAVVVTQPNPIHVVVGATNINHTQLTGTAMIDSLTGGTKPYTITWSNGQTGSTDTGLAPGTYIATVADSNGCVAKDTVTIINTVAGIATVQGSIAFSVYPNPAKSEVIIRLQGAYTDATIRLTDLLGQTLLYQPLVATQVTLDLTPFSEGVYFVEVAEGGKQAIKKLVISGR